MKIDWKTSSSLEEYSSALSFMEQRVEDIINLKANELVWFLEHSHVYTAGTSASDSDLIVKGKVPVYEVGRGGRYTYHGPGQRVVYLMLDLKKRADSDIKTYIYSLEQVIIETLEELGIDAYRLEGKIGIWVYEDGVPSKIAAIGVRVRKWIAYHGMAINVNPDMSYFSGIIPCGIKEFGVSSIKSLGVDISMADLDVLLKQHIERLIVPKLCADRI